MVDENFTSHALYMLISIKILNNQKKIIEVLLLISYHTLYIRLFVETMWYTQIKFILLC